jgi:pimeloyl-ACP methyl ester carboxylesterase
MEALQQASMPFVAFDLPAHGFSEGDRALTFEVADALHAVGAALGPVAAVVAHSFTAGACALALIEGFPVDRIALIAPPLWPASQSRFHRVAANYRYPSEVGDAARAAYVAGASPTRVDYEGRTAVASLDARCSSSVRSTTSRWRSRTRARSRRSCRAVSCSNCVDPITGTVRATRVSFSGCSRSSAPTRPTEPANQISS